MEILGWNAFVDKYKPINNKFLKHDDKMYETFGQEVEYIQNHDPKYVWTLVSGDMCDLVVAGYAYVNRLGYYVTEVPWENEEDYVLISVEKECECYDEETGEGKEDCQLCEGYGLITEYVG